MQNLLNPKWLLLLHTLPVAVLLALLSAEYAVIHTLLPTPNQRLWLGLGAILLVLLFLHAGYALWQLRRNHSLSALYGVGALGVYIAFLYIYCYFITKLFPAQLPRWIVPSEMPLYAGTFLMPTLAHAALVLLIRLTPADRPQHALPNFGVALAIPALVYLFSQLILPLWQIPSGEFMGHVLVVLLVAVTLAFLFFLARSVYILVTSRTTIWIKYRPVWKVLIALVLPLVGLAINNGHFLSLASTEQEGIFGNFDGPWFYGLAVLNGLLLCCPGPRGKWSRLALFAGRGLTLAYTLYFFLVFLPFLPLSVLVVVALGIGFLMLTPLFVLLVHLQELSSDFRVLAQYFPRRIVISVLVGSTLLLPIGITATYLYRRHVLHQALAYLYTPDYAASQRINAAALAPTLVEVRAHKRPSLNVLGSHLPYLSMYFNWLVLDNLTLSNEKLEHIDEVFLGKLPRAPRNGREEPPNASPNSPVLTKLTSRSAYDSSRAAWTSWVDLELTNSTARGDEEFTTTLDLPAGCWVQGYYLDIQGRREKGLLAEKKAATWVYSQIQDTKRDPGILYYLTSNRVALRVFPFAAQEMRRTGFEIVHKEAVTLRLANHTIVLGDSVRSEVSAPVTTPGGEVVYLSAQAKRKLALVHRRPYFHFLLDASAKSAGHRLAYAQQVAKFLQQRPNAAATARYSMVSATVSHVAKGQNWQVALTSAPGAGGFYLEGAIRQVLAEAQMNPSAEYPILVAVTDDFSRAIMPDNFSNLQLSTPEQSVFYSLTTNERLTAYSLQHQSQVPLAALPVDAVKAVRAWPTATHPLAYLPNDGQPAVVLATQTLHVPANTGHRWEDGLWQQGYQVYQALYPAAAETMRAAAIRASFQSGIMTPLTSYIALENEAQKAALRRKQDKVLAGNSALDVGEDTQRMSEPEEWLLLLMLGSYWLVKRYRQGHSNSKLFPSLD